MKTVDYINSLVDTDGGFASSYIEDFRDVSAGCICDIVADLADCSVDIYTQSLIDYVIDNEESVEDALFNGIALSGTDYFSSYKDATYIDYLEHLGSAAQFCAAENAMYDCLPQCIAAPIVSNLADDIGEEIADSQINIIEKYANAADNNDMIEDIISECHEELFNN